MSKSHVLTSAKHHRLFRRLTIHKSQCLLTTHSVNTTCLVVECDTVALVCHKQHLGSEGSADELAAHACALAILTVLLCRDFLEHLSYCGTILGVEVGVDFIEEIEGSWIALLDCKD